MRRTWLVLTGLVTASALVLAASVVHAGIWPTGRPLDRQLLAPIEAAMPQTTHATRWSPLAGYSYSDGPVIRARSGIAVTLSVTVRGAPVAFRVVLEDVDHDFRLVVMKPGGVRFEAGAQTESFSYTFVLQGVRPGPYTVNLLWRTPTGVPVTMIEGTEVVQYAAQT